LVTPVKLFLLLLPLAAAAAGDWQPLFNGRDLDGWAIAGARGQPGFMVENGAIRTRPGTGMLWYTREKISNATLRVVYKMTDDHGNSGVFIRIPAAPPDEGYAIHHGIEVQIDERDDDWHCTGVLYSMTKAAARPAKPAGEWNTMEIALDGLRTIVKLNGVTITDYDGITPVPERSKGYEPERRPRPEAGYIGLQHHDDRAIVYFKEVSVNRK
jgi:3-keto-disaccharide hydrolase